MTKINLDDLTYGEIKELLKQFNVAPSDNHKYEIGRNYLIRTVAMCQVGKLKAVTDKELILSNASWIADTGRFNECLIEGAKIFNDVEPFNPKHDVIVGRGALIDAQIWDFDLPTEPTK